MKTNRFKNFWLAIPLALMVGCNTTHPVTTGVLATPGCTIEAEDGSFKIVSGQKFSPPWQASPCINTPRGLIELAKQFKGIPDNNLRRTFNVRRVLVSAPRESKPLYGILMLCKMAEEATGPASRSYQIEIPQRYVDEAKQGRISVVYETVGWSGFPLVPVDDYRQKMFQNYTNLQANTNLQSNARGQELLSRAQERLLRVSELQETTTKEYAWILWLSDQPF